MTHEYHIAKANFHSHYTDANIGNPWPVINFYRQEGFQILALTEHGSQTDLGVERRAAAKARRSFGNDFVLIAGKENTVAADGRGRFSKNDISAIFLKKDVFSWDENGHAVSLREQVQEIHRQGGLAIVNHERTSQRSPDARKRLWRHRNKFDFDGWELGHGLGLFRDNGEAILHRHPEEAIAEGYLTVASSDSHRDFQALTIGGYCHTYVFVRELSLAGVYEALQQRRTVCYVNGFVYGAREWLDRYREWRLKRGQKNSVTAGRKRTARRQPPSATSLFALPGESSQLFQIVQLMQYYRAGSLSREYYLGEHDAVSLFLLARSPSDRVRQALWKMMYCLSMNFWAQVEKRVL